METWGEYAIPREIGHITGFVIMESQEFFQELIRKRKQWYASTRENNFSFDILLSGLYHDPSHFVYEILQNAEDASATLITFSLFSDKLEIIHNGYFCISPQKGIFQSYLVEGDDPDRDINSCAIASMSIGWDDFVYS